MTDNKPKITVVYQEPAKADGCGFILRELLMALSLVVVGGLLYMWFN